MRSIEILIPNREMEVTSQQVVIRDGGDYDIITVINEITGTQTLHIFDAGNTTAQIEELIMNEGIDDYTLEEE